MSAATILPIISLVRIFSVFVVRVYCLSILYISMYTQYFRICAIYLSSKCHGVICLKAFTKMFTLRFVHFFFFLFVALPRHQLLFIRASSSSSYILFATILVVAYRRVCISQCVYATNLPKNLRGYILCLLYLVYTMYYINIDAVNFN